VTARESGGYRGSAHAHHGAMPAELTELLAEVVPPGGGFGHRQHVHLAYLAVRRHGAGAADRMSAWLRHIAGYERAPQKFNATMTRAWTALVDHHLEADDDTADFAGFAARYPALLDKRLLARHYSPAALASTAARTGWREPDLLPFPWSS